MTGLVTRAPALPADGRLPGVPTAHQASRWRSAWVVVGGAGVACAVSGHGFASLACTVLLLAAATAGERTILRSLPFAGCLTVALLVLAGQVAALVHLRLFGTALDTGLLAALAAGAGGGAWRASTRRPPRPATRTEGVVAVPAAAFGGIGAWFATQGPVSQAMWSLHSPDGLTHLLLVASLRRSGVLSYAHENYPRALHVLAAAAMGGHTQVSGGEFLGVLTATAAVMWAAWAIAVLATALATARLIGDLPARWPAMAGGLAAGAAMLTPSFFMYAFAFDFLGTVALTLVLAVTVLEVADPSPAPSRQLLTLSLLMLLAAHSWQLGAAVVGVPWAPALLRWWSARSGWRVLFGVAACLLLCVPPVLGQLAVGRGFAAATSNGLLWTMPMRWLLATVVVAVWCTVRPMSPAQRSLALMADVCFLGGLALGWYAGVGPGGYYPQKLIWQGIALCLPLGVALLVRSRARLPWRGRILPALSFALALAGGLLAVRTPLGVDHMSPLWTGERGNVIATLDALTTPGVARVTMVGPLPSVDEFVLVGGLVFYHLPGNVTARTQAAGLAYLRLPKPFCGVLAHSSGAVVLTNLSRREFASLHRCAPGQLDAVRMLAPARAPGLH